MIGRLFSRRVVNTASVRAYSRTPKARGGHGHGHDAHHSHAPAGPYDVPHHATYPNKAYLFGINPNVPYQSEGWEWATLLTYLVGAGILIAGATTKPLNSFKLWARDEALAREHVLAEGGEVEFGKFYSNEPMQIEEDEEED